MRSEEHTSELQSLMRNSYAVLCLKKKKQQSRKATLNTRCIEDYKYNCIQLHHIYMNRQVEVIEHIIQESMTRNIKYIGIYNICELINHKQPVQHQQRTTLK